MVGQPGGSYDLILIEAHVALEKNANLSISALFEINLGIGLSIVERLTCHPKITMG